MSAKRLLLLILFMIIINVVLIIINNYFILPRSLQSIVSHTGETTVPSPDYTALIPDSSALPSRQNSITEAVKKVESAVVSVNVLKSVIVQRHTYLDNFFPGLFNAPLRQEISSIGSGVLIADGYIITNSHVVEGATQIKIVMGSSDEYDAQIVGIDSIHDLAILKIAETTLPYAQLGTSADLMIGEWSIAVGNPYGYMMKDSKPSVSVGVISAVDRNFTDEIARKVYTGMIQTDAAINPGNSGGPLVNIFGEVIGINSFIFSESGGSIGIGFAIPIDRVKIIAEELIAFGRVRSVYFGFEVQDLTLIMARYFNLKSLDGVIITAVEPNSPASKAGLRRGDIIIKIGSSQIRRMRDVDLSISDIAPDVQCVVTILRDGREIQITITAGEYR